MHWNPPLSVWPMLGVVVGAVALAALSYLLSGRQMRVAPRAMLTTLALRSAAFCLLLLLVLQPSMLPKPKTITTKRTLAVLIDTSGSMSRRDGDEDNHPTRLAEALDMMSRSQLVENVIAQAKLSIIAFDSGLTPVKPGALAGLQAKGEQTNLGDAIVQAARQLQGDDLAAMLIISDGRNTQGSDPRAVYEQVRTPLLVLPMGRVWESAKPQATDVRRDMGIDSVSAPPRVILGQPVQITANLSARGYDNRTINVDLLEREQSLRQSSVSFDAEHMRRQALFTITPTAVGDHQYQLRIPHETDDVDPTNELKTFSIEVVDPINRLLYIDTLRNERRFLRRVIDVHRNIRYASIVQQDEQRVMVQGNDEALKQQAAELDFAALQGLKVIVIGDVPAAAIGPQRIEALAKWIDAGGSLLLLGGPRSLGEGGFQTTALARLLPVVVAEGKAYIEQPIHVELTRDGAAHPAFQRIGGGLHPTSPLLSAIAVQSVRPAAIVLVAQVEPPQRPIVVAQQVGYGKVAVVLTDSTWRWQLAAQAANQRESEHARFWGQIIDWLLPDLKQQTNAGGTVQLVTDRLEYQLNEPVTLLAQVRGTDGQALDRAAVEFTVATPDNRPIRRMGKYDKALSAFTATFDAYAAGRFRIQCVAKLDGQTLGGDEATINVTQPLVEFTNPQPDHDLLRDVAKLSGGRVLEASDLARIVEIAKLQPRQVQVQPNAADDADPVWNRWPLLLAFLMLTCGEWFVRRRQQWV